MSEVDDVNELIVAGLDMENGVTRSVAWRKFGGYPFYQFFSRLKFLKPGLKR
jgi:hypothetical protein